MPRQENDHVGLTYLGKPATLEFAQGYMTGQRGEAHNPSEEWTTEKKEAYRRGFSQARQDTKIRLDKARRK